MNYDVECVCDCRNTLGESPVWNETEMRLYWVDVSAPSLNWLDTATGASGSRPLPKLVGSIVPRQAGGLLVVLRSAFALLADVAGSVDPRPPPFPLGDERMNDSKCDAAGRVWIGTIDRHLREGRAALYKVEASLAGTRMDGPFSVGNGPAWNPDWTKMYFTDTPAGIIYVYDFDLKEGRVENRRVFARFSADEPGHPDGCTIDSHGFLWSAIVGGGRVARFDPDGKHAGDVFLPVAYPTSCCFGGASLTTLYVTSARGPSGDAPLDGGLFAVETRIAGMRQPSFLG